MSFRQYSRIARYLAITASCQGRPGAARLMRNCERYFGRLHREHDASMRRFRETMADGRF